MRPVVITLFCLFGLPLFLSAQKPVLVAPPALPVDTVTKLITYEGVIEVRGVDAGTLFQRTRNWFNAYYKNPTEVIREVDTVKLKITGKPRFKISNAPDKTGLRTDAGVVQYTITVASKEGKFRYELSAFNWKQPSYFPCERWMDSTSKLWLPAYAEYCVQLDKTARQVIEELHKALSIAQPVKNRDDW